MGFREDWGQHAFTTPTGMLKFTGRLRCNAGDSEYVEERLAQVECFGTRTTAATEALVTEAMAGGRGARFASGLTVAEGGCREPRWGDLPPTAQCEPNAAQARFAERNGIYFRGAACCIVSGQQ